MQYKYKTSFSSSVIKNEQSGIKNKFKESIAAFHDLSPLSSLLEKDDIDFDHSIDIIGVAFNGALVNKFNKNGDGIDMATAISIKDHFIHKPTNIEHNKKNIVGHIISSAFSDLDSNEIIENIDEETLDIVNLAFGSVLYTHTHPEFANIVKQSIDPENSLYGSVSASWELGFNDFVIALGSENLKEAEIIEDEKQIEELSKYLTSFDGDGKMDDGTIVNRLVVGDVYPLGIGFTANPAADVKGVISNEINKKKIKENDACEKIIVCRKENFTKKSSQNKKNNVIDPINKICNTMEKNDLIQDFKDLLEEKMPGHKFSQEAVANIGRVIGDAIKSKSEQYEQELSELEKQKIELNESEAQMKQDIEALKSKLEEAQANVDTLNKEIQERKNEDAFNSRMEQIENVYELSDKDKEMLAKEVSSLSLEEESFASYQEKLSVMWAHKDKEYLKSQEEAFNKKLEEEVNKRLSESNASCKTEEKETEDSEKVVEEALASTQEESEVITNNNTESAQEEPSLKERFADVFSKNNLTIKF